MRRAHVLAVVVAFGGCFNPSYKEPLCGPGGECPSGLTCVGNVCRAEGSDGGVDDDREEVARIPVATNRDVDILFVIDDSPSMIDKQTNLKNGFPSFINALSSLGDGLPNIHLGVVATDLGTKGTEDASAGPPIGAGPGACSGTGKAGNLQTNGSTLVTGTFISDTKNADGSRNTNYTGTLANAFSAIASLGAAGCGFEQPLEAAKRALDNNPTNAGFLRATANLAIIILTDEDDCSMSRSALLGNDMATLGPLSSFRCTRFGVTCSGGGATPDAMNEIGAKTGCQSNETSAYLEDVGGYAAFFRGLKSDPSMIGASAIAGAAAPLDIELRVPPGGSTAMPALARACMYQGANSVEFADPAVRVAQFVNQFARNSFASVCQTDLSGPLIEAAFAVRGLVGDRCIARTIATPPDCIVTEEVGSMTTTLPACNGGSTNKPCWQLVEDTVECGMGSRLKLVIERNEAPGASAVVVARCKV